VRISEDVRRTVVFFGHEDAAPGKGGIDCIGSGFLLGYDKVGYLITAKHLADALGDHPFLVRVNLRDGTSQNILADETLKWFRHPDPTVDVAAIQVTFGTAGNYDALYLPADMMFTTEKFKAEKIGIGDLTYTVGLFRLMSGQKRNLPILHSGIISLMPGDETIPVWDWRYPKDQRRKLYVDGYLVETSSIQGLSGSPVFVRATIALPNLPLGFMPDPRFPLPPSLTGLAARQDLLLLGMWQGSWDAPPDEILSMASAATPRDRVPVGMGIVVPAQKIEEVLLLPEVVESTSRAKAEIEAASAAASADVAMPVARTTVEDVSTS
jgi:hypothetical protein